MNEPTSFDRLADAERALTEAGFTRNVGQAMWVNGRVTAKVVRQDNKFVIIQK